MPVHSREKKESNHDEMEVDFPEQDGSSTDEEDTVSSSVSEDGDSSGGDKRARTSASASPHHTPVSHTNASSCFTLLKTAR